MAEAIRILTAVVADDRYIVAVMGDSVHVHTTAEAEAVGLEPLALDLAVDRIGAFVASARDLRIGYATTPDDAIVYVYDAGDDGIGFAVNLTAPQFSEWGYAGTTDH
jgi:hypothetical protein